MCVITLASNVIIAVKIAYEKSNPELMVIRKNDFLW